MTDKTTLQKSMNAEVGVRVGREVALMAVHVLLLRAGACVALHRRNGLCSCKEG